MSDIISREQAYIVLSGYYHHSTTAQHKALREALSIVPDADIDLTEFCDKLWESAYQRGHEDGRAERGCEGCKYINLPVYNYPCIECSRHYLDMYDNKKGNSE